MHNTIDPPYHLEQLYDIREFAVGEVYYINDDLVVIPNIDRADVKRNQHQGRMVVVVHNHIKNYDPTWPLIHVAPLSHRTDLMRETDLEITRTECPWLKYDGSVIQLALIQPVLKIDIREKMGSLPEEKLYEMLALEQDMILGNVIPFE